jgi:hypothetical protein
MAHAPVEHVGHRLEAAMRMIREARDVVLGLVGAELIQHEERIKVGKLRLPDDARELDAGAVRGRHALDDAPDGAARDTGVGHGSHTFERW